MDIPKFIDAVAFFTINGFMPSEFLYYTSPEAIAQTIPNGRNALKHNDKEYVGSAEQSFIEQIIHGRPLKGSYMACSPCYRDETELSLTTNLIFLKLELYSTEKTYQQICDLVVEFIKNAYNKNVDQVTTPEGLDICHNGTELGSYGSRTINGFSYVYGTGITFPRFSVLY